MPKTLTLYEQIEKEELELDKLKSGEELPQENETQEKQEETPVEESTEATEENQEKEETPDQTLPEASKETKETKETAAPKKHTPEEIAEFVRLRREAAEAKRKQREAEEQAARAMPKGQEEDKEPDKEIDYDGWVAWNLRKANEEIKNLKQTIAKKNEEEERRHAVNMALQELGEMEEDFKSAAPDYDDAANFIRKAMSQAIRLEYPGATAKQVEAEVQRRVLLGASRYIQAGINPVEMIYQSALDAGYVPKSKEPAPEPTKKVVSASQKLDTLKKNMVPKTGLVMSGKTGKSPLTREALANMSNADFSKLDDEEIKRLTWSD